MRGLYRIRPRSWDRPLGLHKTPEKSSTRHHSRLKRVGDPAILSHDHQEGSNEMDPPLCGSASMSQNEFQTSEPIKPQEASPMKEEISVLGIDIANEYFTQCEIGGHNMHFATNCVTAITTGQELVQSHNFKSWPGRFESTIIPKRLV